MNMLRFAVPAAALISIALATNAHAQSALHGAKITFTKDTHDYGNLKNGANGVSYFDFTNTGESTLIISRATGSSGVVVAEWPKEPFGPGAKGKITVKYDTKRAGPISKTVTVTSNAVNEPTKVLRIKGNVAAPGS